MPRLTKLYTRKGDDGTTGLASGQRVPKDSLHIQVSGTVDELNTAIGTALAHGVCARLREVLPTIQNELFNLGCHLAFIAEGDMDLPLAKVEARHVAKLEQVIDELNEVVGPLENFILPGGSVGAAMLHMARCICRRAEREVVTLARTDTLDPLALPYLNRLSDALFVMARYENKQEGVAEPLWNTVI